MAMADAALQVLNAMITPAVFVTASASLIFSTSGRLTRVTDRVRDLTARLEDLLTQQSPLSARYQAECGLIGEQLPLLSRRVSYLHRALTLMYTSVALLVIASVLIGFDTAFAALDYPLELWFSMIGVALLAWSGLLLSLEARLSGKANHREMAYLNELAAKLQKGEFCDADSGSQDEKKA